MFCDIQDRCTTFGANIVRKRLNFNLTQPERNRTGTGNNFNLIMRMTVIARQAQLMCHMQTVARRLTRIEAV